MRRIICEQCPRHCEMMIREQEHQPHITGYKCGRGLAFAQKMTSDKNDSLFSAKVNIQNAHLSKLPVISTAPIPKALWPECLQMLKSMKVEAPIENGQIIIENIFNSDIHIIAARKIPSV